MKLLVIDTETGGTDPAKHSILTLGALVWDSETIGESTEIAVWECPVPSVEEEAMKKNCIVLEDLKQRALSPADAVRAISAFLEMHFGPVQTREKIGLVGHNLGFDIGFLKRLYRLADARYDDVFSHRGLDTAAVIRFLHLAGKLPLESASLDSAIEYFKIEVPPHTRHTARMDALLAATVLNRLLALARG